MTLLPLKIRELTVVADGDENDLLEAAAGGIAPLIPDFDPADPEELGLLEGLLKKKFDPKKHPRWPKGTPKAGQFMRKGDVFSTADGRKWQVINAVKGHIEAIDASGGKKPEHKIFDAEFDATDDEGVGIKGIKPAQIKFGGESSPVVVPYVETSTHDPKIKKHPESKIPDEEWARFGREDQLYYNEIMDRFGKWEPSKGSSLFNSLKGEYSAATRQALKTAYQQTTGPYSGTGVGVETYNISGTQKTALNLAALLKTSGWDGPGGYQEVKNAFDELAEALHWDLYNRTKAPDLVLFHYGKRSPAQVDKVHITGDAPIYAGFSSSYALGHWPGQTILASPTAIRFINLSHFTGGSIHSTEHEMSSAVRHQLDDRSVVFDAQSFGMTGMAGKQAVGKWLRALTNNSPGSGSIIERLKKIWGGEGEIPIPEEPPGIQAFDVGNAQYEPLSDEIAAQAGAMIHKLKYSGNDKAASEGPPSEMGLVPGDFIEGQKGTRYIIIEDAGDQAGLRYVKIEKSGVVNYSRSWQFGSSGSFTNNFFRLDGHIDIPKKKEKGFASFTENQYNALAQGEKKPLASYKPGEMLKVDGEGYKVEGPSAGNKIKIQSLDTGKLYTINPLYKGVPLIPMEDFTPPAFEPDWEPKKGMLLTRTDETGQKQIVRYSHPNPHAEDKHNVFTATGMEIALPLDVLEPLPQQPPEKAEQGDIFHHDGKRYVVTTTLKSGIVKAKPADGPVEKFAPPGSLEIVGLPTIIELFRPSAYHHGEKWKGKNLVAGDLVSAGTGNKIRPYRVVGKFGTKLTVQNLETGEVSVGSTNKSWRTIKPVGEPKDDPPAKPPQPETTLDAVPDDGPQVAVSTLEVGEKFSWNGSQFEVTETVGGKPTKGKPLSGVNAGKEMPIKEAQLTTMVTKLASKPKPPPGSFSMDSYAEGDLSTPGEMEEGQLFLSATGLPLQLKSKAPKGGATAIALHNGKLIKNLPYDKKYTMLLEKPQPAFSYEELKQGDLVTIGDLKPGDQFNVAPNANNHQLVALNGPDKMPTIAIINMGTGEVGPPVTGSFIESHNVTLVAKAADVPPPTDVVAEPDADDLPHAGTVDYEPYGHHKSGTAKHSKVGDLTPGTLFVSKDGTVWKKKSTTSGLAIITDGEKLYAVDETDWVKPADQVPGGLDLIDASPEIGQPEPPKGLDNDDDFATLDLSIGDTFQYNGKWWTVSTKAASDGVFSAKGFHGGSAFFEIDGIPDKVGQTTGTVVGPEDMPGVSPLTLELGDTFHFTPQGGVHAPEGWIVTARSPYGNIAAINPVSQGIWTGNIDNLGEVYGVEKGSTGWTAKALTTFDFISTGDYFDARGGTWKKVGDSSALLLSVTDPKAEAQVGQVGTFAHDDKALPNVAPEGEDSEVGEVKHLSLLQLGDHFKKKPHNTYYWKVSALDDKGEISKVQHMHPNGMPMQHYPVNFDDDWTEGVIYLGPDYNPNDAETPESVLVAGQIIQVENSAGLLEYVQVAEVGAEQIKISSPTDGVTWIKPSDVFATEPSFEDISIDSQVTYIAPNGETKVGIYAGPALPGSIFVNSSEASNLSIKKHQIIAVTPEPPDDAPVPDADEPEEGIPANYVAEVEKNPDTGNYDNAINLWAVDDGQTFTDVEGNEFTKVADGPTQVSVTLSDGKVQFYASGNTHVPHPEWAKASERFPEGSNVIVTSGQSKGLAGYVISVGLDEEGEVEIEIGDDSGNGYAFKPEVLQVYGDEDPTPTLDDDIDFEDALRAPAWPEDKPQPKKGDAVKYVDYATGGIKSGTVKMTPNLTLEDGTEEKMYLVNPDDVPSVSASDWKTLSLEDLVPADWSPPPKQSDLHQHLASMFGTEDPEDVPAGDDLGDLIHELVTDIAGEDEDFEATDAIHNAIDNGEIDFSSWPALINSTEVAIKKGPPTHGIAAVGDVQAAQKGSLSPYLHPKSGKTKHDQIGTLPPGTEFTDKKKGKYRVIATVGDMVVYEDLTTGQQYSTSKKDRVKVTKPYLGEARFVFTTAGRAKLIA